MREVIVWPMVHNTLWQTLDEESYNSLSDRLVRTLEQKYERWRRESRLERHPDDETLFVFTLYVPDGDRCHGCCVTERAEYAGPRWCERFRFFNDRQRDQRHHDFCWLSAFPGSASGWHRRGLGPIKLSGKLCSLRIERSQSDWCRMEP